MSSSVSLLVKQAKELKGRFMNALNNKINQQDFNLPSKESLNILSYGLSLSNFMLAIYLVFSESIFSLSHLLITFLMLSILVISPVVYLEAKRSFRTVFALLVAAAVTGPLFGIVTYYLISLVINFWPEGF